MRGAAEYEDCRRRFLFLLSMVLSFFCKFCSVDFRLSFRHNILSTSIVAIYHLARVQPIQTEKIRKVKSKKETRLKILNKQERKERKSTHIGNTIQASTYHQLKTNPQKYLNN